MNKHVILILIIASACTKDIEQTIVDIPDNNFLLALIDQGVDINGDSQISSSEAELINYLDLRGRNISDLTGIEAFIYVDTLDCSENELTSINISTLEELRVLRCSNNNLTSLDVSSNGLLEELYCPLNLLESLDCTGNPILKVLDCCFNELTDLNITNNTLLTYLNCGCFSNKFTTLDVSNNIFLETLICHGVSQLSHLDITNNIHLKSLYVGGNGNFKSELTSLDVSKNSVLENLSITLSHLSNLDISKTNSLKNINLYGNPDLSTVCVWELPFPPEGVSVGTTDSPNVIFTTDCN